MKGTSYLQQKRKKETERKKRLTGLVTFLLRTVFLKSVIAENKQGKQVLGRFISVINQLDAQNVCFTISLFHASTYFEHMCSSSGGQNCITQPLVMQFCGCG